MATPTPTIEETPTPTPTQTINLLPNCYGFTSITGGILYSACTSSELYSGSSYLGTMNIPEGSIDNLIFKYGSGLGPSASTYSVASDVQSNGKILVGGSFLTYKGSNVNKLIRLNKDGSIDNTFTYAGAGLGYQIVHDVIAKSDGKILVGCGTSVIGINYLLQRLNNNGSPDNTFSLEGFDGGTVVKIKLNSDESTYIGGTFVHPFGYDKLMRLNNTGSIDLTFNTSAGFTFPVGAPSETIWDIDTLSNNTVVVGGEFSGYSGAPNNRILFLNENGTINTNISIGTGFNAGVRALYVLDDDSILVGGKFTTYSGVPVNRIVKLKSNGTIDDTFNIGTGFILNSNTGYTAVSDIKLDSDNNIIVIGYFNQYNGISCNNIIKLDQNGDVVLTFQTDNIFTGPATDYGYPYRMAFTDDNKIFLTGWFNTFENCPASLMTMIHNSGTSIYDSFEVVSTSSCSACCPYSFNMDVIIPSPTPSSSVTPTPTPTPEIEPSPTPTPTPTFTSDCDCHYFDVYIDEQDILRATGNTGYDIYDNGRVGLDYIPCGSDQLSSKFFESPGLYENSICISMVDSHIHNGYPNNGVSYPNSQYWWLFFTENNTGYATHTGPFTGTTGSSQVLSYITDSSNCCYLTPSPTPEIEPSATPTKTPMPSPTPSSTELCCQNYVLYGGSPTSCELGTWFEVYYCDECDAQYVYVDLLQTQTIYNVKYITTQSGGCGTYLSISECNPLPTPTPTPTINPSGFCPEIKVLFSTTGDCENNGSGVLQINFVSGVPPFIVNVNKICNDCDPNGIDTFEILDNETPLILTGLSATSETNLPNVFQIIDSCEPIRNQSLIQISIPGSPCLTPTPTPSPTIPCCQDWDLYGGFTNKQSLFQVKYCNDTGYTYEVVNIYQTKSIKCATLIDIVFGDSASFWQTSNCECVVDPTPTPTPTNQDKTITELPPVECSGINATDIIVLVNSGVTSNTTLEDLKCWLSSGCSYCDDISISGLSGTNVVISGFTGISVVISGLTGTNVNVSGLTSDTIKVRDITATTLNITGITSADILVSGLTAMTIHTSGFTGEEIIVTGLTADTITGTTIYGNGSGLTNLDLYQGYDLTGGTYTPIINSGGTGFSSLTGYDFNFIVVNDIVSLSSKVDLQFVSTGVTDYLDFSVPNGLDVFGSFITITPYDDSGSPLSYSISKVGGKFRITIYNPVTGNTNSFTLHFSVTYKRGIFLP